MSGETKQETKVVVIEEKLRDLSNAVVSLEDLVASLSNEALGIKDNILVKQQPMSPIRPVGKLWADLSKDLADYTDRVVKVREDLRKAFY